LYVIAALLLKEAALHGAGVWRTGFVCNAFTAALFLLLLPLGGEVPSPVLLWQPAAVAILFLGGQMSTFWALQKGDVSVATPVLGAKVVLVALFTTWITVDPVRPALWSAAAMSCLGIGLVSRGGPAERRRHVLGTTWLALQAATSYALFDVLVMKWSPHWGAGRFLPITMLIVGILSLSFIPLFQKPLAEVGGRGVRSLFAGGALVALQAILLVSSLAVSRDVIAINIVYGLRALWSVLAVWLVGHMFSSSERAIGRQAFISRLVGAALVSAAVAVVFI
jgi:hypothetical protein